MNDTLEHETTLNRIAERFALAAPIQTIRPLGAGLINRTYLVTTAGPAYVLQQINGRVFPRPEVILANLQRLSRHLDGRAGTGPRLPALVPTRDGEPGVWDAHGNLWRVLEHIPDTRVLTRLDTPEQAAAVGRALGRFHRLCADLDPGQLMVTLPDFHRTPAYLARLTEVLAQPDASASSPELVAALDAIRTREPLADVLEAARAVGRLPTRVIHGDPKVDNILFDESGERVVALIDLDTVQPGLLLHDLGDCLRSGCNRRGESGAGASFDLSLCRAILTDYARETDALLDDEEIARLYDALRIIPFELAIRFLTDHLQGDRYFRVRRRGENLIKARIQLGLVAEIERKEAEIRQIIEDHFDRR